MLYKYDEIDFRNGMVEEDGIASLDSTVFVSDGGVFKGRVEDHGTLIIRGGEADVVIGRYGKVHAHGGVLHAVVEKEGSLYIHEGRVTVKEQGGYVQANAYRAYITFEESVISNMVFDYNTTIHEHTQAIDCSVTHTGHLTIFRNGMFIGRNRLCIMQGEITNSGILSNICVDGGGTLTCTDSCIIKHCLITNKGRVRITSTHGAQGIIIRNGTLSVGDSAEVMGVTVEPRGKLITNHNTYVTYIDKGGTIDRRGGKLVRMIRKQKQP